MTYREINKFLAIISNSDLQFQGKSGIIQSGPFHLAYWEAFRASGEKRYSSKRKTG